MTRVTTTDMQALRYCVPGSREFFKRHGLDWRRFVREGLPVEELEHIDDAMLKMVIELAKQREASADGR